MVFAGAVLGNVASAADEAQINAAIAKGQSYLKPKLGELTGPEKSLAAYALVKSGVNKSDPAIQAAAQAAVNEATEHYSPGMPRFGNEFAYTVPSHMFLLEAVDPVAYKPALEAMAGYLVQHQQENGSWYYTNVPPGDASDTSQTQFALLGLWAANRAGVDVPVTTYRKAAEWFLRTQHGDGGFAYRPWAGANPEYQQTFFSCTLASAGSLLIVRELFYPGAKLGEELAPAVKPKRKKFGVLERVQDEQTKMVQETELNVPVASIDKAVSRAMKYIDNRFITGPPPAGANFQMYSMYAMERLAALLNTETLGKHDWYAAASDELVRIQTADGSWNDFTQAVPATSFGLLCLSKATEQILGHPAKKLGGGLLSGARGLPSDLSQLGKAKNTERKSKGDVDDLLALLEKTDNVSVAEVQQALLESVDLDNRDQLVGEVDRLRRLAVDPRAEVRRTALWAIGRSGDIKLAPLLIAGLKDVDVGVIREASFGLTVLSRKPTGIEISKGKLLPVDPLDGVEEDAADDVRQAHLDRWIAQAVTAWKKWYLSVRPYEERDDRLSLQRRK